MNVVLQSTDRALIESVRLALAGEGIDIVLNDESGAALPFVPMKVLVSGADFDRAREMSGIYRSPRHPQASRLRVGGS